MTLNPGGRLQRLSQTTRTAPSGSGENSQRTEVRQRHSPECNCCGKNNHNTLQCRYREYNCNFCKKKGHLEKACRSKSRSVNKPHFSKQYNDVSKTNGQSRGGNKSYFNSKYSNANARQHYVTENVPEQSVEEDTVYDISNLFQVQGVEVRKR